jgi:hypothetical protein
VTQAWMRWWVRVHAGSFQRRARCKGCAGCGEWVPLVRKSRAEGTTCSPTRHTCTSKETVPLGPTATLLMQHPLTRPTPGPGKAGAPVPVPHASAPHVHLQVPLLMAAASCLYRDVVAMGPNVFHQLHNIPVELGASFLRKVAGLPRDTKECYRFVSPGMDDDGGQGEGGGVICCCFSVIVPSELRGTTLLPR